MIVRNFSAPLYREARYSNKAEDGRLYGVDVFKNLMIIRLPTPDAEQIALKIVKAEDGFLELIAPADACVISFDDMSDGKGLGKLDQEHPDSKLLRAIVEWGMGPSQPYIDGIIIVGVKVTIAFQSSTTDELFCIMNSVFRSADIRTSFKYV